MNYNDQILENKAFNFFKAFMYNLALAICFILLGVLVLVWGFKFEMSEVLSNSEYPYFQAGDLVIIKPESDFKVGDIVKFNTSDDTNKKFKFSDIFKVDVSGFPTVHRLIAIIEDNGQKYYMCRGDNVGSPQLVQDIKDNLVGRVELVGDYSGTPELIPWQDASKMIEYWRSDEGGNLSYSNIMQKGYELQNPVKSQVSGKVVNHVKNYGTYIHFIKDHVLLMIAIVAGLGCLSETVQNEIDMKRCRRLM